MTPKLELSLNKVSVIVDISSSREYHVFMHLHA